MRRLAALVALSGLTLTTLFGVGLAGPAQADDPAFPQLGQPPLGANDWTCRPSGERPYPAVIVHGTFGDQKSLLDNLSLALKKDGYCVYSLDYGNRATGPIAESALQLKKFVGRVLRSTSAKKVEMVGHSQGGLMPRFYIENFGGKKRVEDLVGLAPSNHGTTVGSNMGSGSGTGDYCTACDEQTAGSAFLEELNYPDETPGPVDYTQVVTEYDEVVVPYTSGFLTPGPRSTNIVLQDRCPVSVTEHVLIPMDPQAIGWVLEAFGRSGPARSSAPIGCLGRLNP